MKIYICQIDIHWENKEETKKRIIEMIRVSAPKADCLIFPEMTLTGFSMNLKISTLTAADHEFFHDISKSTGAIVLYGGVEDNFNCLFSVYPDGVYKAEYRKQHLFSFAGENQFYKPGTSNAILEIKGVKIGLGICYDLRFGYQFWHSARSCDAFLVIANWPETRREHWLTLLKARAIENLCYVIGVNRVGTDPKLSYSGDSAVYDPFGIRLLECGYQEGFYPCEIDSNMTNVIRDKYHFLEDRLE